MTGRTCDRRAKGKKILPDGSEVRYVAWPANGGAGRKAGGEVRLSTVEYTVIFFGSDDDGQYKKEVYQKDSVSRVIQRVRETKLKLLGKVHKWDEGYVGRRMLEMELPGRRLSLWPRSGSGSPVSGR